LISMTSHRRGQGSLEFLMTYGWVLITILVALVVMWQWGLFTMGQRIDPGSFGFWGLIVQSGNDFILHSDGSFEASFLNNVGANISLLTYNVTIDQVGKHVDVSDDPIIVKPDTPWRLPMDQPDTNWADSAGKRFDATIVLTYKDDRTQDNIFTSSGRIWGNIEP
jgi:hypothetical protein